MICLICIRILNRSPLICFIYCIIGDIFSARFVHNFVVAGHDYIFLPEDIDFKSSGMSGKGG